MRKLLPLFPLALSAACAQSPVSASANLFTQPPNCIVAGPASGPNAVPTCRILSGPDFFGSTPDQSIFARINVRNPIFATGTGLPAHPGLNCVGVDGNPTGQADNTGAYYSECAIRNAMVRAQYDGIGGMIPELYFPYGTYKVQQTGAATDDIFSVNGFSLDVRGDSVLSSTLRNDSPQAATWAFLNSTQNSVQDMTLSGLGHTSTGDLIDAGSARVYLHNDFFQESAGIATNLQGASERSIIEKGVYENIQRPILTEGNTNNIFITDIDVSFSGQTENGWFYDSNANPLTGKHFFTACTVTSGQPAWASGTAYTTASTVVLGGVTYNSLVNGNTGNTPQLVSAYWQACGQPVRPESRDLVHLDGDNLTLTNCTMEGVYLSGVTLARTTSSVHHCYMEGNYGYYTDNYSVQAVGKQQVAHLMAAVSATGLVFPVGVGEAVWQPQYITNPANGSYTISTNRTAIFPADYTVDPTLGLQTSSANPNMLRGQYEILGGNVFFANDGNGHAGSRAANGSTAPLSGGIGPINASVAWPAPTLVNGVLVASGLIEQLPNSDYGTVNIENNHMEMVNFSSNPNPPVVASDNVLVPLEGQWIGNPSNLGGEVIVGPAPDGLAVQLPGAPGGSVGSVGGNVSFKNNTIFSGNYPAATGYGSIVIPKNGSVYIEQGDGELTSYPNPANIFGDYANNNLTVKFTNGLNGNTGQGSVHDQSAHFVMNNTGLLVSQFNDLHAEINVGGGGNRYEMYSIGASGTCVTVAAYTDNNTTPSTKNCFNVGGAATTYLFNATSSNYVVAPWSASHHIVEAGANSTTSAVTLPVAQAGTIPGDGVYRAACTTSAVAVASGGTGVAGTSVSGSAYTGFNNFGPQTLAVLNTGIPPGVVYSWGSQYCNAVDSNTGVTTCGYPLIMCNTDTANTKTIPAGTTITAVQVK